MSWEAGAQTDGAVHSLQPQELFLRTSPGMSRLIALAHRYPGENYCAPRLRTAQVDIYQRVNTTGVEQCYRPELRSRATHFT